MGGSFRADYIYDRCVCLGLCGRNVGAEYLVGARRARPVGVGDGGVAGCCRAELATLSRLKRIDGLRGEAEAVLRDGDMAKAKAFQGRLAGLYRGRADLRWALAEVETRQNDVFDASAVLQLNETQIMRALDEQAQRCIENAARQVATATALVPLALADVVVALTANLRMIRQIAQIYSGRSGAFGAWRLTKAVAAHLVATGAVAIGDDLMGSVAGGGVLSKISRRFGEGGRRRRVDRAGWCGRDGSVQTDAVCE